MRLARPLRAELRAVGDHDKDRQRARSLDHRVEQLQSRGIGPMQVFIQFAKRDQLLEQDLEGALFLPLWAEVQAG